MSTNHNTTNGSGNARAFPFEMPGWQDLLSSMIGYVSKVVKQYRSNLQIIIPVTLPVTLEDLYHKKIKRLVINTRSLEGNTRPTPVYISLLNYQEEYVFENMGDDLILSAGSSKTQGDIHVKLQIKKHPTFSIDTIVNPYDLHYERKITLVEYLYGLDYTIEIFGKTLSISYECGQKIKCLTGYGLPYFDEDDSEEKRGALYIFYEVVLPTPQSIGPERWELLKQDHYFKDQVQKYIEDK